MRGQMSGRRSPRLWQTLAEVSGLVAVGLLVTAAAVIR